MPFLESKVFPAFAGANRALSAPESPCGSWNRDGGWALARQTFFARIPPCAEDLANAWAYVRLHRNEIDEQIQANEEA